MGTTTNSKFLTIASREQDVNTGWSIHVLDYKDMTSLVAIVSDFSAFSFTQELNGPGTGSITMDEDSPFWTSVLNNKNSNRTLMNNEYVFEAWDRNTPRFAWLGETVSKTIVAEDGSRNVQISGPGIAQVLTWAKVWRPGWPAAVPIIKYKDSVAKPGVKEPIYRETSYNDALSAFLWAFPVSWPTMRMWFTVFKAAQRRGLLPFVKPSFTATTDSSKKKWQLTPTVSSAGGEDFQPQELDQTLLDFLNNCTGQDFTTWFGQQLNWIMYPGFKLVVRDDIGQHRETTVRFFQGNIVSDERTRDRSAIYNRICAQDVDGVENNMTDSASVAQWNLREQWNTAYKEVVEPGLLNQIAKRLLLQSRDEKDQWTIKVPYDAPGRIPYRNYFVGDTIGVNADYYGNTPTTVGPPDPYRVMAITISVSADDTTPEVELTLKSIIDTQNEALQKQITKLRNYPAQWNLGDARNVDTTGATDGSTVPSSNTLVYNPTTRKWEAAPGSVGGGGGGTVYIGNSDPALQNTVAAGSFWLETYD